MRDKEFAEAIWSLDSADLNDINQCVQGKVSFNHNRGLELKIPIGCLFDLRGGNGVYYGSVEPHVGNCAYGFSQSGKYLTLIDVSASDPGISIPGFKCQTVYGQALIVSRRLTDPNPLVTSISARMPGLREWIGKSPCRTASTIESGTGKRATLEFKYDTSYIEDVTLFEKGDIKISANYCGTYYGGPLPRREFRFADDYMLCVSFCEPVTLDEAFNKWLIKTWDFLSLCMGFRGSIASVRFNAADTDKGCEYYRPLVEDEEAPSSSMLREMPFTYKRLENRMQTIMSSWFGLSGYVEDGTHRTIALFNRWNAPIDLIFLASAQAFEAYAHMDATKKEEHSGRFRSKNHEKKLLDRLEPFTSSLILDKNRFLNRHQNNRNGYTHLNRSEQTLAGEDLYWHTKTVQFIDYAAAMNAIGLSPDEIFQALQDSQFKSQERYRIKDWQETHDSQDV